MNITSAASYNVSNSIRPSYMSQQQDMADPIKANPTDTAVATEEKLSPVEQKMEDKKQYREEMKQKERRDTDRDEFFDKQQKRNQEIATHMKEAFTSHHFYDIGNDHDLALNKENYEETVKDLFSKGFKVQADDRQMTVTSKLHQLKLEMSKESYTKYVEMAYGQKFAEQVTGTSSADKKSSAVNSAGIYTNQIGSAAVKTASAAVSSVLNGTLQGVASTTIGTQTESKIAGATEAVKVEAYTPQHQEAAAVVQPQPVNNTAQESTASQPAASNSTAPTSNSSTTEGTSTTISSGNTANTAPAAETSSPATSSQSGPVSAAVTSITPEPTPVVTSPAPVSTTSSSPTAAVPVASTTIPTSSTTVPVSSTTTPISTTTSTNTTTSPAPSTATSTSTASASPATTPAPTSTTTAAPTTITGTLTGVVNTTVTATATTVNTTTSATKNLVGGLRK
ncbi:RodZ family helix-turn-helix domain-containing protein [Paenibacillus dauci]|uniref:hypothetical protein n=1 Tax=Paenibacillus dauci TaxID=1567106 RepID=UPI00061A03A0|nr:hypothetical protein [Paenibacillus dauci]